MFESSANLDISYVIFAIIILLLIILFYDRSYVISMLALISFRISKSHSYFSIWKSLFGHPFFYSYRLKIRSCSNIFQSSVRNHLKFEQFSSNWWGNNDYNQHPKFRKFARIFHSDLLLKLSEAMSTKTRQGINAWQRNTPHVPYLWRLFAYLE